jgi:hypothetical protein
MSIPVAVTVPDAFDSNASVPGDELLSVIRLLVVPFRITSPVTVWVFPTCKVNVLGIALTSKLPLKVFDPRIVKAPVPVFIKPGHVLLTPANVLALAEAISILEPEPTVTARLVGDAPEKAELPEPRTTTFAPAPNVSVLPAIFCTLNVRHVSVKVDRSKLYVLKSTAALGALKSDSRFTARSCITVVYVKSTPLRSTLTGVDEGG